MLEFIIVKTFVLNAVHSHSSVNRESLRVVILESELRSSYCGILHMVGAEARSHGMVSKIMFLNLCYLHSSTPPFDFELGLKKNILLLSLGSRVGN